MGIDIELEVINRFKEGDMNAFGEIYNKTKDMIYNVIYRLLSNEEDAKDVMHDVYVKVFEKRVSFRGESGIATWIYRTAVNQALNYGRRKSWFLINQDNIRANFYGNRSGDDPGEEDNRLVLMKKLMRKLKPEFRACIVLKDMEGASYEEISEILNVNIGTIRSRLSRGRAELAKLYKREMSEHGIQ
jgi:RNA polymerase sigma-70 factor (ECF subfamily)